MHNNLKGGRSRREMVATGAMVWHHTSTAVLAIAYGDTLAHARALPFMETTTRRLTNPARTKEHDLASAFA
jgi:hypothetical protein